MVFKIRWLARSCLDLYLKAGVLFVLFFDSLFSYAGIPPATGIAGAGDSIQQSSKVIQEGITEGELVTYCVAAFAVLVACITAFLHSKKHHQWSAFVVTVLGSGVLMVLVVLILNHIKTVNGA